MTSVQADVVLRHIRDLAAAGNATRLPDRQLLDRFATDHEQAAFEVLVRRHGPLVLGVCRRVLHNPHDAEDAFQATFLALARRAGSAGRRASLGTWLYRVAYHTALRARKQTAVRRKHEDQAPPREQRDPLAEVSGRELLAVLDEELHKLPERLRVPLVLCYLEGKTRDEAARELGWSLGTLKRRLEQARASLRARVAGRGVGLAALLAAGLGGAAVSPALAAATAGAARLVAAGNQAPVSAGVKGLMTDALRAMTAGPRKAVAAVFLAATLIATGAGLFAYRAPVGAGGDPPAPRPAPPNRRPRGEPTPPRPPGRK
jgi:RNA polymerase sigma-70 factor (ECF subfamily)